jgi:hypothetical protein
MKHMVIIIGLTTGFELQLPLTFSLQFNIFLWHECYCWTSCMNYNDCNLSHMKPHTSTTHAIQLQLCRINYHATPMQLICNYCWNVILTLFCFHPSINDELCWFPLQLWLWWKHMKWLQLIGNYVTIHINTR